MKISIQMKLYTQAF